MFQKFQSLRPLTKTCWGFFFKGLRETWLRTLNVIDCANAIENDTINRRKKTGFEIQSSEICDLDIKFRGPPKFRQTKFRVKYSFAQHVITKQIDETANRWHAIVEIEE